MAKFTIQNTRPARSNAVNASSLDDIQPARLRRPPTAMDRQPVPRNHTRRTTCHPRPGDRDNWPAQRGAGQTEDCYNCRPEGEAATNGTQLDRQEESYNW